MLPDDLDAGRLWDMLEYAREITDTIRGISFDEYVSNKTLRLATERRIEIIGEAARNVSRVFQVAHPEIPWQKIVTQRHVLAHEYGDIKQELVYRVAVQHIPDLILALVPLVPNPPGEL